MNFKTLTSSTRMKTINVKNKVDGSGSVSITKNLKEVKKQRKIEREKGSYARSILTNAINDNIPDGPKKQYAYKNYTDLAYRIVFGNPSAELKKLYGLKPKDNLRKHLTTEQLKEIETVEKLIAWLINIGLEYAEIKVLLQQQYTKPIQYSLLMLERPVMLS